MPISLSTVNLIDLVIFAGWFNKATTSPYLHQMEKDIRKSRRGLYTTNRKMIMTKKKRFRNFNIIMQKFQMQKFSHKFILENSNFYFFFYII